MSSTQRVTLPQLRRLMPNLKKPEDHLNHLNQALKDHNLTSKELTHFFGQIRKETTNGQYFNELANGKTSADRQKYFEKKYGHREDLGNKKPIDGWLYKGRGVIQLTGKTNYEKVGNQIGVNLVKNPDLAAKPEYAWKIGLVFFTTNVLPKVNVNDKEINYQSVRAVTKKVNGGLTALSERIKYTKDSEGIIKSQASGSNTSVNNRNMSYPSDPSNKNYPSIIRNENRSSLGGIDLGSGSIDALLSLKNVQGVKIDMKTNKIDFLIGNQNAECSEIDIGFLATALKVYLDPYLQNKTISQSLDPNEPTNPYGDFMRNVLYPDETEEVIIIQRTRLGELLFDCDYLMKQMSLGVQSDSNTPFNYPSELSKLGLMPIYKINDNSNNKAHNWSRLWIEAHEVPGYDYQDSDSKTKVLYIKDVIVKISARQMNTDDKGALQDSMVQNPNHSSYIFAATFTKLYDVIAKHYPCFGELKKAFKSIALARWIYEKEIPIDRFIVEQIYQTQKVQQETGIIRALKYGESKSIKVPVDINAVINRSLNHSGLAHTAQNIQMAREQLIQNNRGSTLFYDTHQSSWSVFGGVNASCVVSNIVAKVKQKIVDSWNNDYNMEIVKVKEKIKEMGTKPFFFLGTQYCEKCGDEMNLNAEKWAFECFGDHNLWSDSDEYMRNQYQAALDFSDPMSLFEKPIELSFDNQGWFRDVFRNNMREDVELERALVESLTYEEPRKTQKKEKDELQMALDFSMQDFEKNCSEQINKKAKEEWVFPLSKMKLYQRQDESEDMDVAIAMSLQESERQRKRAGVSRNLSEDDELALAIAESYKYH